METTDLSTAYLLLEMLGTNPVSDSTWNASETHKSTFSPEQYLQKGERILSLLRERKKKTFVKNPVFGILSARQMQGNSAIRYALNRIWTKIATPAIQEASSSGNLGQLESLFPGVPVTLSETPEKSISQALMEAVCRKKDAIGIEISYGGKDTAVACLNYPIKKSWRHSQRYLKQFGKSSCRYLVDLADELSKWIMVSQVIQHLEKLERGQTGDVVETALEMYVRLNISQCTTDGTLKLGTRAGRHHSLMSWLEENDICRYSVSPDDTQLAIGHTGLAAFSMWKDHSLANPECLRYASLPNIIQEAFCLAYSEHAKDMRTQTFFRNMDKEYAHVYETKKGIPNKVVQAMENSGFNDFFGYIEFDSECCLEKTEEVEREFRALQIFFAQPKHGEVSLRFRKLGQYKASGLYFPFIKCLCVDVRKPSSMAHEYLHMINFEYGNLSRKADFQPLYNMCADLLEEAVAQMDKDDSRRLRWEGNTKYNRDYYLEPTEAFARCGEIYLTCVQHVCNSICHPQEGFEYPDEKCLADAARTYYGILFASFAKEYRITNGGS